MMDGGSLVGVMAPQHGCGEIKRKQLLYLWVKIDEILFRVAGNTLVDNFKELNCINAGQVGEAFRLFG